MPIKLILNIDNVADLMSTSAYGTAAKAVVYRGTAEGDSAYAAAGTVSLVSGTNQYEWWDAVATSSSWFKYRVTDGGGTALSAFSEEFQATALDAYATLDDLVERLGLPDETQYNLLSDILVNISGQFDAEAHRQFYRIPQVSGNTTRYYDGDGSDAMFFPEGIVSLTSVELADSTGGAYTTIGTADWFLRPAYPSAGWPYTSLELFGYTFGLGYRTVKLTGAFGFAEVPALIREAVLQLASRTYNESKTRHAGVVGMADTGYVQMPLYRPDAWHRALQAYGRKIVT